MEYNSSNFSIVKELGRGTFGITYLVNYIGLAVEGGLALGQQVAIKKIRITDETHMNEVKNEIAILQSLSSFCRDYIVCYYGYYREGNSIYVITEYINGSDLLTYIHSNFITNNIPIQLAWNIMSQLVSGLNIIHSNNISHRDIKPENIMITEIDGRIMVKYIDFGIACSNNPSINPTDTCRENPGTDIYMSPEYFFNRYTGLEGSKKLDVWSLGVTLYRLINKLNLPYTMVNTTIPLHENLVLIYSDKERINKSNYISEPYIEGQIILYNYIVNYLVDIMLTFDPALRPNIGYLYRYMQEEITVCDRPALSRQQMVDNVTVGFAGVLSPIIISCIKRLPKLDLCDFYSNFDLTYILVNNIYN